ncbi:MAG: DUF6048 family protein [Bacteroidia bacterium]|nr:DUF6048 family protein [Bacteroidia bacterium]
MRRILLLLVLCTSISIANAQRQLGSTMQGQNRGNQNSQNTNRDDEDVKPEPVLIVIKDQGISVGVDIAPIITRLLDNERTGIAFVGRYGFGKRWWAAAEAGFEHVKYNKNVCRQDENGKEMENERQIFNYKSDGGFMRFGADYDIYMSDEYPTNNNILVGFRYGYAFQEHECSGFEIADSYWGAYKGSVDRTPVNSHWLEGVFGLRCEMLPYIYMSWSFRAKVLLTSTYSDELKPYAIAGFGKSDKRVAMGFTYTIEYQLPTNRKQKR